MFTCEECYAVCEGQEKHPFAQACDDYDGAEEEVSVDPYNGQDIPTIFELKNDTRDLYGALAILASEVAELQRKFDTIIAAVVKAAGPEEER